MPHNFASLNWCSDCEISVDEETTELYGKHWFSLLSPTFV